jgi:hypothetical protein
MATLAELETALRNADKAGDMASARQLAAAVMQARGESANQIPGAQISGTQAQPAPRSLLDRIKGLGETGLTLATGATTGTLGALGGVAKTIGQNVLYGASDGLEKNVVSGMQAGTYLPKTEAGQEYVGDIGQLASNLPPVIPQVAGLNAIGQAARQQAPLMGAMAQRAGQAVGRTGQAIGDVAAKAAPSVELSSGARAAGQAAEDLGIRTMTSDYFPPQTTTGKLTQRIFEKIPITGTGGERAGQQAERVQAIKNIVSEYGADVDTPKDAAIYASLTQKKAERINTMHGIKQGIKDKLPQETPVPVNNTLAAFDKEIESLTKLGTPGADQKINALTEWRQAFANNPDFTGLDAIRAEFGTTIKQSQPGEVRTALEAVSSKLYPSVKQDMHDFIKQNAGESSSRRWAVANDVLSQGIQEINKTRLRSVFNSGEATPEVVNRLLFSQKPSEVRLLMRNLTPEGQAAAQTAVLQKAIQSAGGLDQLSPDKFLNSMKRLGPQAENVFTGESRQQVDGLIRALDFTRRAGQAVANPETGAQTILPTALTGLAGALGGFGGLVATAGIGGIGRLYESPAARAQLLKIAKTKQNTPAERQAMEKLSQIAAGIKKPESKEL